jgi:hypothetical protein
MAACLRRKFRDKQRHYKRTNNRYKNNEDPPRTWRRVSIRVIEVLSLGPLRSVPEPIIRLLKKSSTRGETDQISEERRVLSYTVIVCSV